MSLDLGNSTLKDKKSPVNRKKIWVIEGDLLYLIPCKIEDRIFKMWSKKMKNGKKIYSTTRFH